ELVGCGGHENLDRQPRGLDRVDRRFPLAASPVRAAAIAHGGLTVEIRDRSQVSQPPPVSLGNTVVTSDTTVTAETAPGDLHFVPPAATVGDLVNALNILGVKPSDLIIIFQSLSAAGAISADIEVQ
ncbi:MAG: flagellar basal body P-ring protein FlgI, partial [Deltaproteobacteria bacterium]|nr:flagellar basal body P-ring protein FlgI [Deltaproteobacteria bacterium]